MSQIRVALKLEGRSGILAALVARLNRQNLAFKSHKLNNLPGGAGREILVDAEGEVSDPRELISGLKAIRGVEDVSDIIVDGTSILNAPAADADNIAAEPEAMTAESLRSLSPARSAAPAAEESAPTPEPAVTAEPDNAEEVDFGTRSGPAQGSPDNVVSLSAETMPDSPMPGEPDGESIEVRMRRRRRRR